MIVDYTSSLHAKKIRQQPRTNFIEVHAQLQIQTVRTIINTEKKETSKRDTKSKPRHEKSQNVGHLGVRVCVSKIFLKSHCFYDFYVRPSDWSSLITLLFPSTTLTKEEIGLMIRAGVLLVLFLICLYSIFIFLFI